MYTAPSMEYPPYKFGTMVEDVEIGVGQKLYCVEYLDVKAVDETFIDQPGRWMGQIIFNSEEEARQAYAILPEFKKQSHELVIREYVVKKKFNARVGEANGLFSPFNGRSYAGGGTQIQILDRVNFSPKWSEYFEHQRFTDNTERIRNYLKILR